MFHYPDGPEQRQRDAAMRQTTDLVLKEARGEKISKNAFGKNPNAWVDKAKKESLFARDVDEDVEEWWSEHGSDIICRKKQKIGV